MEDPILDEIHRVREKLIREHGGIDGYFAYIQRRERQRKLRQRRAKASTARKRRPRTTK